VEDVVIVVSVEHPVWHRKIIEFLRSVYDKDTRTFASEEEIVQHIKQQKEVKFFKKMMSLVGELRKEVVERGIDALSLELQFDEKAFIESELSYIKGMVEIEKIEVRVDDESHPTTSASPGHPVIIIVSDKKQINL